MGYTPHQVCLGIGKMEKLNFTLSSKTTSINSFGQVCGVVNSGNMEVMILPYENKDKLNITINTTVIGFTSIWEHVLTDFANTYSLGGCQLLINDSGATPAIVALRLRQLYEKANLNKSTILAQSYIELDVRGRINSIVDNNSFQEILPPINQITSPHLSMLDLPVSFDDGIVIGHAKLNNKPICIASQNYAFMGGAIGEVNGAKLAGICLYAIKHKVSSVILLLDSGGVRLHEANAGEIAISEVIRAIIELKKAKIPVVAVVAGRNGAFGGVGIIAKCVDKLIVTENARTGVSGPEVIETVMGVGEYDSSDRALVWRTCGGRHRALINDAVYSLKATTEIKNKIIELINSYQEFNLDLITQEHDQLKSRLLSTQNCHDGIDIWKNLKINTPESLPDLTDKEFMEVLNELSTNT